MYAPGEFKKVRLSDLAKYDLSRLFRDEKNIRYLVSAVDKMMNNQPYFERVLDTMPDFDLRSPEGRGGVWRVLHTPEATLKIAAEVRSRTSTYTIPYLEDRSGTRLDELSALNKQFLFSITEEIIRSPENIDPRVKIINPETGIDERRIIGDWSVASYYDGVWRPEQLFRNPFNTPSGSDRSVSGAHIAARGLGSGAIDGVGRSVPRFEISSDQVVTNRWAKKDKSTVIEQFGVGEDAEKDSKTWSYKYPKDASRARGNFPFWQVTPHHRHFDRHPDEGLREAGRSDRRVDRPRGYDMSELMTRPS